MNGSEPPSFQHRSLSDLGGFRRNSAAGAKRMPVTVTAPHPRIGDDGWHTPQPGLQG